jgi:nucleoside-diphosphate-sugar epimerase
MEKILITGGCGYIGTNLVKHLLKQKYKITVIDTQWFGNFLPKNKNLKVFKMDIRNLRPDIFNNHSTVIHLASISNDPSSDLNPKLAWEVGPLATYKLLEVSKKKKN